jgi:hypothetical protein
MLVGRSMADVAPSAFARPTTPKHALREPGSIDMSDDVTLRPTSEQALVIYESFYRFDRSSDGTFHDQAEQRVLWDIEVARIEPRFGTTNSSRKREVECAMRSIDGSPADRHGPSTCAANSGGSV